MNKETKNIVILGAGESGTGAAVLAMQKGWDVFVSDRGHIRNKYLEILEKNRISYEQGKHNTERILQADLVVKSPGIPENIPLIQSLSDKKIPVISEIEFAFAYAGEGIITGITGSNGKTTVTMMLGHILKQAGYNSITGGNIGNSFAGIVAGKLYDYYVLELSSFQLDGIATFKPHIAILTNITPDHLDRYGYDPERYASAKFRITENQSPGDYFIYDADDDTIRREMDKHPLKARKIPFSIERELPEGAFLKNDEIILHIDRKTTVMNTQTLAVQGRHNLKNTMAASLAASLLQVRRKTLRESMTNFEGAPHRLEKVMKIRGVQFINDSKATNINATYYALDSMRNPTVWIVGGVDKGNDYMQLMPLVREKVKAIVCLGLDNDKILETFSRVMPVIVETRGAEEAVKVAFKLADSGDTVLLSPACASFDLFDNYEDRGNQFKEAILKL